MESDHHLIIADVLDAGGFSAFTHFTSCIS